MGWMFNDTPWPFYPQERHSVHTVQKAGWPPGPVWTGLETLDPIGIRFQDGPARSESLYRRYPGPHVTRTTQHKSAITSFEFHLIFTNERRFLIRVLLTMSMRIGLYCEIWGYHSGVTEDSSLLGSEVVPLDEECHTFQRSMCHGQEVEEVFFLGRSTMELKAIRSFEKSETTEPRHSVASQSNWIL